MHRLKDTENVSVCKSAEASAVVSHLVVVVQHVLAEVISAKKRDLKDCVHHKVFVF